MAADNVFADGIEALYSHIMELQHQMQGEPKTSQTLLEVAFETMTTTVEELRVAEEEMRQQNEALIASHDTAATWQHYYEDLFQSAPEAYLVTDLNGVIQQSNRGAVRLLGGGPRFLKGKPLTVFVAPNGRSAFHSFLTEAANSVLPLEREMLWQPRRGVPFTGVATVTVIENAQGKPTGLRWLVQNTTFRNEAEIERYRVLVEEIQDYAICLLDTEGKVINWNSGAAHLFGYTAEEILGQSFALIFTPEGRAAGAGTEQGADHRALRGRNLASA